MKTAGYLPILNILVPHTVQIPWVAGLPFFIVTFLSSLINLFALHLTQYASMPKQEVSKIKDTVYKMIVTMLGCTCTSIRMRRYKFRLNLAYFCIFSRYYSNLVINNKILLLLIENSYQKNVIATPVRKCTNYTTKPFWRMTNPLIQTATSF